MKLFAQVLLEFLRRLSGGNVRMNGATTQADPLRIEVKGGPSRVCLVQVHLDGSDYRKPAPDEMICLDVHESREALPNAVKFVSQAYSFEPGSEITYMPTVFALVNVRSLTADDLWVVNKKLIPSGATVFDYPKGCASFAQAMYALGSEIAKYRESHEVRHTPEPAPAVGVTMSASSATSTATSTVYGSAAAGAAEG